MSKYKKQQKKYQNTSVSSLSIEYAQKNIKIEKSNTADYSIDQVVLTCENNELVVSVVSSGSSTAQFAFYVFRNEVRIHAEWYKSTPSMRFDTKEVPGFYRVLVFLLTPEGKKFTKYSNPVFINPVIFTLSAPKVPMLGECALEMKGAHWKFPALYFSGGQKRLFVMLTAAVDRTKHTLPVFNRWTWVEKFSGHVLCVADPTLELDDRMKLGWYLGTEKHDATAELSGLILAFAKELDIADEKIVFWGSSAGGFGALALANSLQGSTAIAINAQTNAFAYHVDDDVKLAKDKCFGGKTEAHIYSKCDARINMGQAWGKNSKSRAILVQNKLDTHHYNCHYQPFWSELGGKPEGGLSSDGRHFAWIYEDKRGHVPESEQMVPEILRLIDGDTGDVTPQKLTTEQFL